MPLPSLPDPDPVEALVKSLESEDAFERLAASRRLVELVQSDFDYRWDGDADGRAAAVARIRAWCTAQRKRLREREKARRGPDVATLDLSALKSLPPEKVQAHLKALLAKAQLAAALGLTRPRCEACRTRPATVEIVVPGRGVVEVTRLCDPCALERGEFGPSR